MAEFLSNYGLWIVLGGIFVAMHMFGMGCGGHGSHQNGSKQKGDAGATTTPGTARRPRQRRASPRPPQGGAVATNPLGTVGGSQRMAYGKWRMAGSSACTISNTP